MRQLLIMMVLLGASAGCAAPRDARERRLAAAGACDACARPTGPERGGIAWRDGRASCATCRAAAVLDADDARAVLREAARLLEQTLELKLDLRQVRLELVDRPSLMRRAEALRHPNLRGLTEITELLRSGVVVERGFRVLVLWGLPRTALLGILAHELFHVWQTSQGGTRPDAQPAFREGAANYAQLKVLERLGAQRWARQLQDDRDPVYGVGLRRFQRLVKVEGEAAAVRMASRRDRFPPGF